VRYLSLAEALAVAEAVTGIDVAVLARGPRINLLDSALHAPQASFGGHDMYPEFLDQAAVLAVRISRNHPLLDGNKRLAWGCLTMFCMLNGHELDVPTEEAVSTMLAVAAGDLDEAGLSQWLAVWVARKS
jgi:death-on-curing protein